MNPINHKVNDKLRENAPFFRGVLVSEISVSVSPGLLCFLEDVIFGISSQHVSMVWSIGVNIRN